VIEIRPAILAEAHEIWRAEHTTAESPGLLISSPEEVSLSSVEARIHQAGGLGWFVVAARGGRLVGHAILEPMGLAAVRHVYRLTVVVHPGQLGQGIGTALLRHLQSWSETQAQLSKIELLVRKTNAGAIRLYRRLGFVEEGVLRSRVRLPNGDFVDDLAMAWFPATRAH
jgi:ribosomal protein S18 acetylase RimI-like enzyme